jgi:hypothetical protein
LVLVDDGGSDYVPTGRRHHENSRIRRIGKLKEKLVQAFAQETTTDM